MFEAMSYTSEQDGLSGLKDSHKRFLPDWKYQGLRTFLPMTRASFTQMLKMCFDTSPRRPEQAPLWISPAVNLNGQEGGV